MDLSAVGTDLSIYHIEAAIAATHASANSLEETNWQIIISLYDTLMRIQPSPVVALNRAIALAQDQGPGAGLLAIEGIEESERLVNYPFYHAAIGELELRRGSGDTARKHFQQAHKLARNASERRFYATRIESSDCRS